MDVDKSLLLKSSEIEVLVSTLLESSPELPLDILYTDPTPSDFTLVLLAAEVYTEKESGETDQDYGMYLNLPKGWRVLVTGSNQKWNNGYFGTAFVNTGSQQVVVAHRGTSISSTGALLTDTFGIWGRQYTKSMNSAVTFVDTVRQVIDLANSKYNRRYNLTITGHSLGGWLAQITTFTVKCLNVSNGVLMKNISDGVHAKAVVFDSPGAKDMLNDIKNDYYDSSRTDVLDWLDITVFVSAPNRLNTYGAHLGTVYRVLIDVSKFDSEDMETALYNLKTHEIGNFVEEFRKSSPRISEVLDWAKDHLEYTSLFKDETLNQSNNYHGNFEDLTKKFNKIVNRYKVVPHEPQSNDEIKFKINFDVFSEDEFQILNQLTIIQTNQKNLDVLNKFVLVNKLKLIKGNLFPYFEINHINRTIICQSKQLLGELTQRLKQLMRWLRTEFTEALGEQSRHADLIYRDEGQHYLNSLPKTLLDFNDSIGLQEFLLSPTDHVFWIVSKDSEFEMTRLHNIWCQIKNNSSSLRNQYEDESHNIFLDWPRLEKLYKYYGSPVNQNNLMVVDGSSSPTTCAEVRNVLENYLNSPPSNIKKLVFISPQPKQEIFNSFKNIKEVNAGRKINLLDLSTESQTIVLKRKLILTGNIVKSFQEILGDCSIPEINLVLCSDYFKKIVTIPDYVIIIKDTRPTISDLQMPFIKTNITTSKEHVCNCIDLPNSLVMISGLNSEDLDAGAGWEQLAGKKFIIAEGDAEISFKNICDKNPRKTIYLFEVSGDARADVHCKHIFNRDIYIPRKFIHRACINLKNLIEATHAGDVFVICSLEHKAILLGMIENSEKSDIFSKNLQCASTKEGEADVIHKNSKKNIHFIKIEQSDKNFKLEWRFSHGSVKYLFPYLSTKSFEPIDELTLSQTERNLVIITDDPGMGKTTTLSRLSWLIETAWVIHIELKKCREHLVNLPDKLTPQNVASFIVSKCCSNADDILARGILEYLLQSNMCSKRVVLMFDGFDEIDDYIQNKDCSKDKFIKLLTFLQTQPTIQVFLTARKYLKDSLETKLSQLPTSFVKITIQEQQDFLFTFWRSFIPFEMGINREGVDERLKEYAIKLISQSKQVLGPDLESFMGIPLQVRMLADILRPQGDLLVWCPEDLLTRFNIASGPNLYQSFIRQKYEIYLQDKTTIRCVLGDYDINEKFIEPFNKDHGELAFKSFYSEFYNKNFKSIKDQKLVKLNRIGIIHSTGNGEFQFIHRTFAEYFCAQMVVYWLKQQDSIFNYQLIKDILLPHILLPLDSKVIRLFMNVELNEVSISDTSRKLIAQYITQLWLEGSAILRNQEHQTALHIAVQEGNEHIITLLFSGLNTEVMQETLISFITQYDLACETALHIMDNPTFRSKAKDDSFCDRIMENILKFIETCSNEAKERFFFVCLFNRDISNSYVSNYLLKPGTMSDNTSTILKKNITRVKEVELESGPFKEALLNNIEIATEILSERLINNTERYCLLLMKHKGIGKKSSLHLAVKGGHLDIVKIIAKQTSIPFTVLMERRDDYKKTPLLTAARHGHLDIFKYLEERGADINARCNHGISALMYAAGGGDVPTLKYLVECGADINSTGNNGDTALHGAALFGHLPVIEYLVESGADIKSTDNKGETAMHEAARQGHLSIIEYFIKRGADVNATDNDGDTVLHIAAKEGHIAIIKKLVEIGCDVNPTEKYGWTALHIAAINGHLPVIEYLVENSDCNINSTNNNGKTVLHVASHRGHLPIVKYLLQQKVNPDTVNSWGRTALSEASLNEKWDVVHFLLEWGADVNADRGEALHYAIKWGKWSTVKSLVDRGAFVRESTIDENLLKFKEIYPNYAFRI